MKKIIFINILIAGVFAFSSCNNEPDFPGLDEKSQIPHVVKYAASYAGAVFSEDKPAKDVLPAWLLGRYYTADKGSTAMVDYKYAVSIPEYVLQISGTEPYTLDPADYQEAWGDGSSLTYFSPSKPAINFLPAILGKAIAEPAEGNLIAVAYNEANEDGVAPVFSDDFESKTLDAWENVTVEGTFAWKTSTYDGNTYAQQSAYKHDGPVNSYLISKEPIAITSGLVLAFDALLCNYRNEGGRVSVLISTNLSGFTSGNIAAATWDDITTDFVFATSLNNSGDITPVDDYSLDGYIGKSIYIAFQYIGNGASGVNETTTVRLDNIAVKEAAQVPVDYAPKSALYQYTEGVWKAYTAVDILQPEDYTAMDVKYFTSTTAQAHLPGYLALKYPLAISNTIKAVAFKLSATTFMAAEFQKEITGWTSTATTTVLTDEYEYDGSKWVYVRTVPKAALNETFEGRDYTEKEPTIIEGWLNVTTKGEDRWRDKKYSNNIYTEATAYNAKTEGELEMWMVTPALDIKNNYILTFEMVSGHWRHEAMNVYISTSFSGNAEDLEKSIEDNQWKDLTGEFDFPKRDDGYSPFTNVGKVSLADYVGQQVYIGLVYKGNKSEGKTSTVQLDNIYVGE